MVECLHARAIKAMLAGDGLPVCMLVSKSFVSRYIAMPTYTRSTGRFKYQKAAPI
jgi:hypothetical protein